MFYFIVFFFSFHFEFSSDTGEQHTYSSSNQVANTFTWKKEKSYARNFRAPGEKRTHNLRILDRMLLYQQSALHPNSEVVSSILAWGTKIVRSFLVVSEFPFFQVKMFTGSVRVLLTSMVKKEIILIIKFKRKFNIQYQVSPTRQRS